MNVLYDDVLDALQLETFSLQDTRATYTNKRFVRLDHDRRLSGIVLSDCDAGVIATPVVGCVDGILASVSTGVARGTTSSFGGAAFQASEVKGIGHGNDPWLSIC